jgi:uncharacterized protein (TIGR02598 family)
MHRCPPPSGISPANLRRQQHGFSLVEISLALGIIAFAFIALLGLLPIGLQTFRTAIDTGNEARIVQSLFSRLLATEFEKVQTLDFENSKEIFYFDEEGMPTDTSLQAVPSLENQRLYGAKMFIEKSEMPTETLTYGLNAIVVFANTASPARAEFEQINTLGELRSLLKKNKGASEVKVRPLVLAKMDGKQ